MTSALDTKAPLGVIRETMTAYGRKELTYVKERLIWRGFKVKQVKIVPSYSLYDRPKYVVIGEKLDVRSILESAKKVQNAPKIPRHKRVYHLDRLAKLAKPKFVNSDKYKFYKFSG